MKREDRRPTIHGLDDIECSNYLRGLFKHDNMINYVCQVIQSGSDKSDYFTDFTFTDINRDQVIRIVNIIEEKIRCGLVEYSNQLEESIKLVNTYIDGLLDAHGVPAYEED